MIQGSILNRNDIKTPLRAFEAELTPLPKLRTPKQRYQHEQPKNHHHVHLHQPIPVHPTHQYHVNQTHAPPKRQNVPYQPLNPPLILLSKPQPIKQNFNESRMDDFKLASYNKAQQFFNQHSYCHKIKTPDEKITYQRFKILEPNGSFKQYSVGIYLYLEMLRTLIWFFLVSSLFAAVQMYFNYQGNGLSSFQPSYSLTILMTSLGNNTTGTFQQVLIQTLCDVCICLLFGIFIIFWRRRSAKILNQIEEDMSILDPQKYAVSINFGDNLQLTLKQVSAYIEEQFGNLYEMSAVYDFKRKFASFEQLDEYDTQIRLLQLKQNQSAKESQKIEKLKTKREKLHSKLNDADLRPTPISYITHFRTLQDRARFIKIMQKYTSIDETYYHFKRALCCCMIKKVPTKYLLNGEYFPMIKSRRCGRPQDMRWENLDISGGEKCIRFIIGMLFILIVLACASLTIAACSIQVSITSDCTTFDSSTTLAQAQKFTDQGLIYCYCDENILSYFTDINIHNLCQNVSQAILVKTSLQFGAAAISTVTNILLAVLITLVINFMKPQTNSDAYVTNFVCILAAIIINSAIIPLLLNASIFGGRPVLFFTWINFQNFNLLQSYSDFLRKWYAYVGPFYLNFFLIAVVTPWINLIKVSVLQGIKRCRLRSREGRTIQKIMNHEMIGYGFNLPMEAASVLLYLFFSQLYSSGMPVIIILTFLILVSQYTANKIIIGRYSKQISANEEINDKILKYIPYTLLIHILFAMWTYTCQEIFSSNLFQNIRINITYFNNDLDRIFYIQYLLGLAAFVLVVILIDFLIIRLFVWLGECCGGDDAMKAQYARERPYNQRLEGVNILGSYNIVKNPTYKATMRLVNEILGNTFNQKDTQLNNTKGTLIRPGDQIQFVRDADVNQKEMLKYFRSNMPVNITNVWSRTDLHRKVQRQSETGGRNV